MGRENDVVEAITEVKEERKSDDIEY